MLQIGQAQIFYRVLLYWLCQTKDYAWYLSDCYRWKGMKHEGAAVLRVHLMYVLWYLLSCWEFLRGSYHIVDHFGVYLIEHFKKFELLWRHVSLIINMQILWSPFCGKDLCRSHNLRWKNWINHFLVSKIM
jgi:hypothetical protein